MQPTHRKSYGRTRRGRSHEAIEAQVPTTCPITGTPKQHHRAAAASGYVRPGLTVRVPKLKIGSETR